VRQTERRSAGRPILGLVTDDRDDTIGRSHRRCKSDDVLDERHPARAVQHLRLARLHARAQTGGEDDYT